MPGLNNWLKLYHDKSRVLCSLDFSSLEILSKDECIDYNIQMITTRYDNLYVSLSGGIDSEFVANSLLSRGIKFTPVIVDYVGNSAEVWYAYLWCRENNITPFVINLKPPVAAKTFSYFARKYSTSFVSSLDFVINELIDGHLLNGCAEPFEREFCNDDKLLNTTSDTLSLLSYDYGLDLAFPERHPGSFFTYTPNLLYHMVSNLDYTKPVQIAMSEYYGVRPRPKISAFMNTGIMREAADSINTTVPLHIIKLGKKEQFLETARNKGIITYSYIHNK